MDEIKKRSQRREMENPNAGLSEEESLKLALKLSL